MGQLPIRQFLAVSVALLGLLVMLGWVMHAPLFVQIAPGQTSMALSSAVCFLFAGTALLLPSLDLPRAGQGQLLLGSAILIIAALALVENLADIDLGLDFSSLQMWAEKTNPNPGRMSLNSAIAFTLSGACLVAMRRPFPGVVATALLIAICAVTAIGAIGLAGYALGTEFIYRWYGYSSMALHTAGGMTVLGIALYLTWRELPWRRDRVAARPDAHIAAIAAGWLAGVAIAAGVTGFVVMQQQGERTIDDTLTVALRHRVDLFQSLIEARASNMTLVASRPGLLAGLRRLADKPDDAASRTAITNIAASFLPGGFSAVAIYDNDEHEIAQVGKFADRPDLTLAIDVSNSAELIWKDGFILRNRAILRDANGIVGAAVAEQPLPVLTRSIDDVALLGATGEAGVCGLRKDVLYCFPTRLQPQVFALPVGKGDRALPIAGAFEGRNGVVRTVDYRRKNVVAAFGPIGTTGLGTVIKLDATEMYQPVRDRMAIFAPVLLALVIAGAFALRAQITPLAAELVRSHEALRTQSDALAHANTDLQHAMLAKDRFLATMSHELRTPMNAILGFSGTLLMKLPGALNREQEKQLRIIQTSAKHLLSLINDLLDVAKIESGEVELLFEPLIAQELVNEIVDVLRPAAENKGLRLECKVPATPISVRTDRRALLQILTNLMNNGLKYTSVGSVSIEVTQRLDDDGRVTEFVVTDTGVGIREEEQAKLFTAFGLVGDPYIRHESTGLGLYVSQRLAGLIGGKITLQSEWGRGSVFTLTLTTSSAPTDEPASKVHAEAFTHEHS